MAKNIYSTKYEVGPKYNYLFGSDGNINPAIKDQIEFGNRSSFDVRSYHIDSEYSDSKPHGASVWDVADGAGSNHDGFNSVAFNSEYHLTQRHKSVTCLSQTGVKGAEQDIAPLMNLIQNVSDKIIIDALEYELRTQFLISRQGLSIVGKSKTKSVIKQILLKSDGLKIADGVGDLLFDYFTMVGMDTTKVGTFTQGISTTIGGTSENIDIKRINFERNSTTEGFNTSVKLNGGASGIKISECKFNGGVLNQGSGYGVLTGNIYGLHISDCTSEGDRLNGNGSHAFYLSDGASDCFVHDNIVSKIPDTGIQIFSIANKSKNILIKSNFVSECGRTDVLDSAGIAALGWCEDVQFSENHIHDSKACGVIVSRQGASSAINDVKISNTIIKNSNLFGVDLRGVTGCDLVTLTVKDSSLSSDNTYSNIRIIAENGTGCEDVSFTNVKSHSTTGVVRSPLQFNATTPIAVNTTISNFSKKGGFLIDGVEANGASWTSDASSNI